MTDCDKKGGNMAVKEGREDDRMLEGRREDGRLLEKGREDGRQLKREDDRL